MPEKTPTPIPGQFLGPAGPNEPRQPRQKTEPAAPAETNGTAPVDLKKQLEELEKELHEEAGKEKEVKPLTAEEKEALYTKGLEEAGLTLPEARAIMEKILVNDFYEESFTIGPLPVKLRTRTYSDTLRAQQHLEVENPTYNMSVQDLVARYNVAASLSKYGDNIFEFPTDSEQKTEAAFQQRLAFVMGRPAIVMAKLMELVYRFDLKMGAVFAEGAPQDF